MFEEQVHHVCEMYEHAADLHEQGVHVVSTDEKSGIQALERMHPTLPAMPGRIERREFDYIRHGTQCLIANFEVATGQVLRPTIGFTRTEVDFTNHIAQTVEHDPWAGWIFLVDNLDIHCSETLVTWLAEECNIKQELGKKGKEGILKSVSTRAAFLSDPSHRIRFVYLPKHTSWLNQVERWFSILVSRLLNRSSFRSIEELTERILAFIDYFNRTMAKPFKWKYKARSTTA